MLSTAGQIIFSLVICATFLAFMIPVIHRIRIILKGKKDQRFDHIIKRAWDAFIKVFFQRCTLRRDRVWTGFIHLFIFYGALTFDTMSVNHVLEGYLPGFYLFGGGNFGLFFSFIVDLFAVLVLVAVVFMAFRRYIIRPEAYKTTLLDSGIIYMLLTIVTLSYLYFETFSIAHHPGTERLSFIGAPLAQWVNQAGLSASAVSLHFNVSWWLHVLIVFGFIAYVPYSKYFHMFAGSFNVLVRNEKPLGALDSMDIEHSEVFGVEKASDYTWKDLLDTFACMECGRCQDVCPAFETEKPLSPKMIIFNLKRHLLDNGKKYIAEKRDDIDPLIKETVTEGEIWTCTTCGACMYVCPVEIEHIPKIVGLRQGQVLMESKFPSELNQFFKSMETNSNPWGIGFSERADWAEGLDVKQIKDHPDTEFLLWVGCAGSFDERGKKITQALVKILNNAGVDFAILGTEEKCCGDSSKRLGNEYLFQMQAAEVINQFEQYNVKKIITLCPHGFNTFQNDYPRLLDKVPEIKKEAAEHFKAIQIFHHVPMILELIKENRLPLINKTDQPLTYHDSCYLGRHNKIIKQPREVLNLISQNKVKELENNKEHSFCCGAGGGLMWTEESLGSRINHKRTQEVINSKVSTAATSCPFCLTMIQDALEDKEVTDISAKDIAQLVAECL
ncbi:MAG: 4Fe-4S dicluster domain-containing protein [Candidatus Aminicenantes bacterium]|nr:4Fe-4S dicluster domain-containing protein [Candidatus Aminicenantes bacterium]